MLSPIFYISLRFCSNFRRLVVRNEKFPVFSYIFMINVVDRTDQNLSEILNYLGPKPTILAVHINKLIVNKCNGLAVKVILVTEF